MNLFPTIIGLCLALGGPALLASVGDKFFGNLERIIGKVLQQIVLAALLIAVLMIVLVWEHLPLSSIGWHPLRWQSVAWGLMFAGILIFIYSPL